MFQNLSSSYKHIVITRFNLRVKKKNTVIDTIWSKDRKSNPIQTDKWLRQRIDLFENFCLPSMLNQSCKNFIWLIYFDSKSSKKMIERINTWVGKHDFIKTIFKDSYDDFMNEVKYDILKDLNSEDFIITTRLDNDDALHKNAIAEIQKKYIPKHQTPINLSLGYCMLIQDKKIKVSTRYHTKDGPFVSLIEKVTDIQTVYFKKHTEFIQNPNLVQISNAPLWIQMIHDTNMLNFVRGKVKRVRSLEEDYSISNKFLSYNLVNETFQTIWYVLRLILPSKFRIFIYKIVSRLFS